MRTLIRQRLPERALSLPVTLDHTPTVFYERVSTSIYYRACRACCYVFVPMLHFRDSVAFLSPTLTPGREVEAANKCSPSASQQEGGERSMAYSDEERTGSMASEQNGAGRLPFTVSPSWRQRPHGIWQEPPGAPQTEPCAEWSPPPSPMEHNRVNGMGGKEDNNCWETTSLGTGTALEDDREHNRKDNDENANCNAAQSPKHLYSTQETLELKHPGKDVPAEETPKPPLEANRRHSVLSRRLSVVPNAHLSP